MRCGQEEQLSRAKQATVCACGVCLCMDRAALCVYVWRGLQSRMCACNDHHSGPFGARTLRSQLRVCAHVSFLSSAKVALMEEQRKAREEELVQT